MPSPASRPEAAYLVDPQSADVTAWEAKDLGALGFTERGDLQRWIAAHPELLGASADGGNDELLLLTEEFSAWEHAGSPVRDRFDLLFVDRDGCLVVAELKRGQAEDTVELQALKYAAYCSTLTLDDIVELRRAHEARSGHPRRPSEEVRQTLTDHADSIEEDGRLPVRVLLVAQGFTPSVTHSVLFLREHDLDIRCIELTVRDLPDGRVALLPRTLVPPVAANDFLVRRQRQEEVEVNARVSKARRRRSVVLLLESGELQAGARVHFGVELLGDKRKSAVEAWASEDPRRLQATWTGLEGQNPLAWEVDGSTWSPTALATHIFKQSGHEAGSVPGPDYWVTESGETLSALADRIAGKLS